MDKLKSRKLWVTILSALVGTFYPPALPIILKLAPIYVGGQSVVDALAALKSSPGK